MCNTTSILDDTSPPTDVPAATIETTESASAAVVEEEEDDEDVVGVGKMIQDLAHSDNARVDTALDALSLDLDNDKEKRDTITVWGGCAALVHLLKDRLKRAMKKVPACHQVTEVNEFPELETIEKTLRVIISFTYYAEKMGLVGIVTVGGVAATVKVMKTFPKCQALQGSACAVLCNLAFCNIGKKNAVKSGGLQLLLAAINNHLDSADVCEYACRALFNIVWGTKEHTELLISLGGGSALSKVRKEWPDNDDVQTEVRDLAKLLAAEMNSWVDEE
jgi:hypothetical protein